MDAQAEATIRIQPVNGSTKSLEPANGHMMFARTFSGHGASTDIVVASARAYLSALNKMLAAQEEEVSVVERHAVQA
jgi:2-isopropylmalate synthase